MEVDAVLPCMPSLVLPFVLGLGGWLSGMGALVLGAVFLHRVLVFARTGTIHEARHVFRSSLLFLPALLVLFVVDGLLAKGM